MTHSLSPRQRDADEAFAKGVSAQVKGDLPNAIKHWQRSLSFSPQYAPALYNLAVALALTGNENDAAANYEKLLAFNPSHKDALYNLGNLKKRQSRDAEAETLFRRLTEAHPDFVPGFVNLAKVYSDRGNIKAAEPLLRKAVALDPTHVIAHWNLSHLLLRLGRWEEAWREYEWRLKLPNWLKPPVAAKPWTKDIPAKRILLWNDQGIGDAIQFLRYPQMLASPGREVFVLVQDNLKTIAASASGVTKAFGPSDLLWEVDAQAPLLSMPHLLGMPLPQMAENAPYLASPNKMPLPHRTKRLAIGLAWAGNQKFSNDIGRSATLSALRPLFEIDDIDWYSLQFGEAQKQIAENNLSGKIHDLTATLHDFSDTAAALNALDLVISVDTSVAHLAGAMGRPCWLLLPAIPDWRFKDDEVTRLWYPSLRPFRQTRANDWSSVAAQMAEALKKYP